MKFFIVIAIIALLNCTKKCNEIEFPKQYSLRFVSDTSYTTSRNMASNFVDFILSEKYDSAYQLCSINYKKNNQFKYFVKFAKEKQKLFNNHLHSCKFKVQTLIGFGTENNVDSVSFQFLLPYKRSYGIFKFFINDYIVIEIKDKEFLVKKFYTGGFGHRS